MDTLDNLPPSPSQSAPPPLDTSPLPSARFPRRQDSIKRSQPKPLPLPNRAIANPLPHNLLPSAPASPPTPAPSPGPGQRAPIWNTASETEDTFLRDARGHFSCLDSAERQRFLAEILNLCDSQQLSFVQHFVAPRLKKDPFKTLPNELCLRVRTVLLVEGCALPRTGSLVLIIPCNADAFCP